MWMKLWSVLFGLCCALAILMILRGCPQVSPDLLLTAGIVF